jgi:hypothetical protein
MTISPETRDLAQRLLTYEADADKRSTSMESATLRAYEKLRQCLVTFAGVASFQSIAMHALVLAQADVPNLCAVQVTAEGSLQGLGDVEFQTSMDKDLAGSQQAGEDPPDEAEAILIARILGLLLTFLGEALTLSLLRNAWPDATFDDRNSGNGRKA